MSSPYLGQIRMFGFNYAPKNWALCNGQLLPISQNTALFSVVGTYYGGNGIQNFALPNMQSRTPMHWGANAGNVAVIGETGGTETVSLLASNIPTHGHNLSGVGATGDRLEANGMSLANVGNSYNHYGPASVGTLVALAPGAIATEGASVGHSNIQPYLAVTFCIALQGIFPSRN